VPADQHLEVTRTMPGPGGTWMPRSLLTEIAAYGRFPRMGSPYCRKSAKESAASSAWTSTVNRLKRELGRPVRILKVMGPRSDEGPERKKRAAFRTVQANNARVVDDWLPAKDCHRGKVRHRGLEDVACHCLGAFAAVGPRVADGSDQDGDCACEAGVGDDA
jgi:hypothetical protein